MIIMIGNKLLLQCVVVYVTNKRICLGFIPYPLISLEQNAHTLIHPHALRHPQLPPAVHARAHILARAHTLLKLSSNTVLTTFIVTCLRQKCSHATHTTVTVARFAPVRTKPTPTPTRGFTSEDTVTDACVATVIISGSTTTHAKVIYTIMLSTCFR